MILKGDVVRILRHRNAFDEDVSKYFTSDRPIGSTFVVGEVEDPDAGYPCAIVFPKDSDGEFWREDDLEIVQSGPVRAVTRKEIVPGVYGRVEVKEEGGNGVVLSLNYHYLTASELRAAAATFIELADALDEVA